jgi:hypothetical protein
MQQQPQPVQTPKEPVLINTVIQIYTNDKAPNQLFSEMHTLTSVNGKERVEISRNSTLDTNYGTLVSGPSRTHGNFVSNPPKFSHKIDAFSKFRETNCNWVGIN